MTRIFVSIVEPTPERAIEAIRLIRDQRVGVEVRVDQFDPSAARGFDPRSLRNASSAPMIYTRRSGPGRLGVTEDELEAAIGAGFDLVDIELDGSIDISVVTSARERLLLSLHDYRGVPDLDGEISRMESSGIPNLKIAVTPRSFDEDRSLLAWLDSYGGSSSLTLFGMGSHGLYSRSLAPFLGSRLSFVAVDDERRAAPGQLTIDRGLDLWSEVPERSPDALFAILGRPASHSRSPGIHNRKFREGSVSAAYGIIEDESIDPVLDSMERKDRFAPAGLSVTAPFKRDLFREASRRGWTVTDRADRVEAANTVVRIGGRFKVDNTDILGFDASLGKREGWTRVAVLGAGGTARAALAALDRRGEIVIFNRTLEKARSLATSPNLNAKPLDSLGSQRFGVLIDTLPASAGFETYLSNIEPGGLLIRAAYDAGSEIEMRAREKGITVFHGLDLLEAQAIEQSRLFIEAAGGDE